ncbi:MAG TPA: carbohydrate porin, partial [Polyangiaceae bacterium]
MRFPSVFLRFSVALGVLSSSPLVSAQDDAGSASPTDDAPEPAPVAAPAQLPAPAPTTSSPPAPAATPTSIPEPTPSPPPTPAGFAFGSYGRVRAASDLRGHSGESTNIVAFGTRYDLGNYAELELRREDHPGDVQLRVVSTLGFQGDFFHYTGSFNDQIGIRNLYAEVEGALLAKASLWAGSRMVRGDDVYLLNFWPLDNLNLIGGGAAFSGNSFELKLHGGLTRPSDPFYTQQDNAVPVQGFLPQTVSLLDRPRSILAARAVFWPFGSQAKR